MATKKKTKKTTKNTSAKQTPFHPSVRTRVVALCHDADARAVTQRLKACGADKWIASNLAWGWVKHFQATGSPLSPRKSAKHKPTPPALMSALGHVDMSVLERRPQKANGTKPKRRRGTDPVQKLRDARIIVEQAESFGLTPIEFIDKMIGAFGEEELKGQTQ